MRIRAVHIEGYRSLGLIDIAVAPETQILCIVGNNGLGKTNILEALYLLSISKPFRGKRLQEVLKDDEEVMQIRLSWEEAAVQREHALFGVRRPFGRQFQIDGREVTPSEVVGQLKMVLFHPGDLGEFAGSPNYRRRYINVLATQVDPSYTRTLIEYTKVLKQRNMLLRTIRIGEGETKELDFWDASLARLGSELVRKRMEVVEFFAQHGSERYALLAGEKSTLRFAYHTAGMESSAYTEEELLYALRTRRERDISYMATTVGPHRDDLTVALDGKDVFRFASRGELRSVLLTCKLLEIMYIEKCTGSTPILLLDDVFSELDIDRQTHLLGLVAHVQTIVTVTHTEPLDVAKKHIQVVRIEELLAGK